MSMYTSGDIVTIVGEDVIKKFERVLDGGWRSPYGMYIAPEMTKYCGETYTITMVFQSGKYHLKGNPWTWDNSCFEVYADPSMFEGMENLL